MVRALCVLSALVATGSFAQPVDPGLYAGLKWRNIGPFRAGRVASVTGVIGQPGTYYMGLPDGGVWKTTSAGVVWYPIFDSVTETASVGAIEVAPSDPNVIYAGTGDLMDPGCGLWKSTDAGASWTKLGFQNSRWIESIIVDQKNPDVVLIGSQGLPTQGETCNGVFRSTDGGQSWTRTLGVDGGTGITKLAYAYDRPNVVLATTIAVGANGTSGFGSGRVCHLFKSVDRGVTWSELKGGGLPSLNGRTMSAVAMNTDAKRMFVEGSFGLYRSDDGGSTWRRMAENDRRITSGQGGYNTGVYVNTGNPDIVYTFNTCSYVSRDGGQTFTGFKGAPGGDDPQIFWLDPTDPNRMFMGMDQGATVSHDGGKTWSLWYNQNTAQVYKIAVDNRYPYWVYATEQDSGAVGCASRGNYGAITFLDWTPHPGYEFGSLACDPLDPNVTYCGGEGSGISKVVQPSGQWMDVSPHFEPDFRLRHVLNQPIGFSPKNPRELLAGFQCLMATTDGGKSWKYLSQDLTAPGAQKPLVAPATPATPPRSGNEAEEELENMDENEREAVLQGGGGGSIESFSVSSLDGNLIWVGTSNGLIKLTRDHGKTWSDVTPKDMTARGNVTIDASHHDPAIAYAAIDRHNGGDGKPYVYRTLDFGKTWTLVVEGLPAGQPSGSFCRVVRADTKQAGLLFCGTETSVFVSLDNGDHWGPLRQNLPTTSYRDLLVKNNDVVVGTYGRGFWVLDDISPLRELARDSAARAVRLFEPGGAIRVRRNVGWDTPFPPEVPQCPNPPDGAILYYALASAAGSVKIEFVDSSGRVMRTMSSDPVPVVDQPPPPAPDYWLERPQPLPISAGMHRINWNLRMDPPASFSHSYEINANVGRTPLAPEGPLVPPGSYTVRMTVDGQKSEQKLAVVNDPRSPSKLGDVSGKFATQLKLYDAAKQAMDGYNEVASLRGKVAEIMKVHTDDELGKAAKTFDDKLATIAGSGGGRRAGGASGSTGYGSLQRSFVSRLSALDMGDMTATQTLMKACLSDLAKLQEVRTAWAALQKKELVEFNAALKKNGLGEIGLDEASR